MMVSQAEMVHAKVLWNGERYSLGSGDGVYVIKTYKQAGSGALTSRSERRLTTMTRGFCGIGKRWKAWEELSTPIEEQSLEQEVTRVP